MNLAPAAFVIALFAMPPRPGVKLTEEAWQRYHEMGLNRYHSLSHLRDGESGILSVEGTVNFPVIIMEYSDVSAQFDSADFYAILFDESAGTAHRYYSEVSYGKIDLAGQVSGPYTAEHDASYYANNNYGIGDSYPRCAGSLVYEACEKSDPFVDYSVYDNDGDGYVDVFTVIHVGHGAEETADKGDIWSHEFSLSGWESYGGPGAYQTNDGVIIDVYTMNPELFEAGMSNIGVYCHEWGHGFGLPDLYITEGPNAGGAGLGYFCCMAAGSWGGDPPGSSPVHFSAWCKNFLGWLEPQALERGGVDSVLAEIPTSTVNPSAWRIFANPAGVDWSFERTGFGEYFLVENRQPMGFDASLPGGGLLILHVDESQETNSYLENPLVGIMQADGDADYLFVSEAGSASDLWSDDEYGFNNSSVPSSRFYDGLPSGASVSAISASDSVMTARLEIEALLLGEVRSYPNPFNINEHEHATIAFEPTDEEKTADQYPSFKVYIYNLAGERVRTLDQVPREVSIYGRAAFWDGRNDNWIPVAAGLYFYIIETYEGEEVMERSKGMLTFVR